MELTTIEEIEEHFETQNIYAHIGTLVELGDEELARDLIQEVTEAVNYSYTDLRDSMCSFTNEVEDKVIDMLFE